MARLSGARKKPPTSRERADLELLSELRRCLESRGWSVHLSRTLEGRGGDCIVRGERRVIVSQRLVTPEKLDLLAEALRLDGATGDGLSDAARALLGEGVTAPLQADEAP